jgi:5,10-methylenetetrahydromethanopterin reductase
MARVAYGIGLPPEAPVPDLLDLAEGVERLGYDYVWVNDERLERDPFTVLAAIAMRTRRIRIGPGVTNPYSRHPALLATAAATLDELSGARAVLGIGAGGTNHAALGITREAPVVALREALSVIRGLLAGDTVTVEGRVIRAGEAKLGFEARAGLPIYVGAGGAWGRARAGALADGVIVGNVVSEAGWRYALERVSKGADRGGRNLDEVALVAWVYACVADDGEGALDAIRPMAATSLVTSRPVLDEIGIEMPEAFAREMDASGWSLSRESVTRAGRTLSPEIVNRFGIAGSPAEVRERLDALLRAFPEISQVAIVPYAPPGGRVADTVERFITDVAVTSSAGAAAASR